MLVLDVFQDGLEVASSEDAAEYGVQEVDAGKGGENDEDGEPGVVAESDEAFEVTGQEGEEQGCECGCVADDFLWFPEPADMSVQDVLQLVFRDGDEVDGGVGDLVVYDYPAIFPV